MTYLARALVVVAVGALLACGGGEGEAPAEAEDAELEVPEDGATVDGTAPDGDGGGEVSGRAVFTANCATCHGEDGRGQGPAAVGLEPPPADFTDGQWVTGDGSLEAIRNTIENGSPGTAMIAWKGTLTEAQIEAVARYVRSLGGGGGG